MANEEKLKNQRPIVLMVTGQQKEGPSTYSGWLGTLFDEATLQGVTIDVLPFSEINDETFKTTDYPLILIDAYYVEHSLGESVQKLRQLAPEARLVVTTASPTWRRARDVMTAGANDYVPKSSYKEDIRDILKPVTMK